MRRVAKQEQRAEKAPANSVPLSTRKDSGTPKGPMRRSLTTWEMVAADRSGRAAIKTNLLNVSTMVRMCLGALGVAGRSVRRSIDHSRRGPGGGGIIRPDQVWECVACSS